MGQIRAARKASVCSVLLQQRSTCSYRNIVLLYHLPVQRQLGGAVGLSRLLGQMGV